MDMLTRLWRRMDGLMPRHGCWLWPGALNGNGYPVIREGGRSSRLLLVHRVTLAHATGEDGVGMDAAHSNRCVSRRCIRPDHLSWKRHNENMNDVIEKHGKIANKWVKQATKPLLYE